MKILTSLWSIRGAVRANGLTLTDVPAFVRRHGFDGLEIVDRDLPIRNRKFLEELAERCSTVGCVLVLDSGSDLTHEDEHRMRAETERLADSIETARILGAGVMRVALGGQSISMHGFRRERWPRGLAPLSPSTLQRLAKHPWVRRLSHELRARSRARVVDLDTKIVRAIGALRALAPQAEAAGVRLGIENHWGISARPDWLLRVVDAVASPWVGTCPDFGNFPRGVDRYRGLAALAPRAVHVQAKAWRIDARGEESSMDFGRCLAPFRNAGYTGAIGIEYEGGGDGIALSIKTRNLIRRNWPG